MKTIEVTEEYINDILKQLADVSGKLCQAKTFLRGLHDTPNSVTLGTIRSFIEANYEVLEANKE